MNCYVEENTSNCVRRLNQPKTKCFSALEVASAEIMA